MAVDSSGTRRTVAYLGPPSSYTHQAAVSHFDEREYSLEPKISIPDVFSLVQTDEASCGVVPFENSSNGSVGYTLDCFVNRDQCLSDVVAYGEIYMDVQHCLVGHLPPKSDKEARPSLISPTSSGQATPTSSDPSPQKPRSQPLADLSQVTDIYSHPQAFGQCQRFLSTYLKQANHHEVTSTSKAAEIVEEEDSPSAAAISSVLAAKVYGLSLLAKDIQDREDNTTRFLILRKESSSILGPGDKDGESADWKSLMVFSVDHASRGALAKALFVFEKQKLNLTHFNSRPSRLRPWHYIFIVECESHATKSDLAGQIRAALEDLKPLTEVCRCLGYWRSAVHG